MDKNILHKPYLVIIVTAVTLFLFFMAFIPGMGGLIENEYLITASAIIPLLYTNVAQHLELG